MKGQTQVNICVNKLLFQVLVVLLVMLPPAVLPTVVPSFVEIPSQLAQQMHMDSQNFDAIIREPCMYIYIYSYYDSAAVSHYLVKMTTSAGYCSFRVH